MMSNIKRVADETALEDYTVGAHPTTTGKFAPTIRYDNKSWHQVERLYDTAEEAVAYADSTADLLSSLLEYSSVEGEATDEQYLGLLGYVVNPMAAAMSGKPN